MRRNAAGGAGDAAAAQRLNAAHAFWSSALPWMIVSSVASTSRSPPRRA